MFNLKNLLLSCCAILSLAACAARTTLDDHVDECFAAAALPSYTISTGGARRFSCARSG